MRSAVLVAYLATSAVLPASAIAESAPAATAHATTAVETLSHLDGAPRAQVLAAALDAYADAARRKRVTRDGLLTVIDYTRPSTEPRLWVIDLAEGRVLFHELVAHGQKSGDNRTTAFSNAEGSHMTSRGLFVTADPYVGRNGYSLRLHGLDAGVNDNALTRAIVVHGAAYVSETAARRLGRLGRSWGCPAVRTEVARTLIDAIKGGTVLFAYGAPEAETTRRTAGAAARGVIRQAEEEAVLEGSTVRQTPSPWNSLGRFKLMFPNPHNIYLHDTPARIASTVEGSEQTVVHLDTPLPVTIGYATAFRTPDGLTHYRRDVYGRDAKLVAALARRSAGAWEP